MKALLLLAFLLSACASQTPTLPPSPAPTLTQAPLPTTLSITLDKIFVLGVGQRAVLESAGLTIELQTILRDWRCPIEVECSEAGAVDLALYAWLSGLEPTRFEMTTNPIMHQDMIPYDAYEIRLLSIFPHPKTIEQTIPMEDYRVTFAVSLKPE